MTPTNLLILRALSLILWRLTKGNPTIRESEWFNKAGWPADALLGEKTNTTGWPSKDEPGDGGGEP